MKYSIQIILGTYLGLAPIYWLPGISTDALSYIKAGLFFLSIAMVSIAGMISGKTRFPPLLLGPLGFALTLLSTAGGLLQSNSIFIFEALKDYLLVFSALWIFYILGQINTQVRQTLTLASSLVAFACALVVMSKYAGGPDFTGPRQYVAEHLWISGFGSLRTGWSNGVALYVVPLLLTFTRGNTPVDIFVKTIASCGIGAIVLSQYVVAGRAGLLASILIICVSFSHSGKRKFLAAVAIGGALILLSNLDAFYSQMRIVREDTGRAEVGSLNTISAGRMQGNLAGLEKAWESPLFGNGLGHVTIGQDEIHNLWIRLAAESGFITPILLLAIVFKILKAAYLPTGDKTTTPSARFQAKIYLGGILGGLVISMLEPRMLLGTFQTSIMWWAFAGIVTYRHASMKRSRPIAVQKHALPNVI